MRSTVSIQLVSPASGEVEVEVEIEPEPDTF